MTEIVVGWVGDSFVPLKRFMKICDENFVVGQRYVVQVGNQQSETKRRMFHATMEDIYASLPDPIASVYLSVDHFRKALTVACGYATQKQYTCKTKTGAIELASALRDDDPYSVIKVDEDACVVTKWRARSTSAQSMDGATFSRLVDDVLARAGALIEVDLKTLRKLHEKDRLNPALAPPPDGEDTRGAAGPALKPRKVAGPALLTADEAIAMLPDQLGIEASEGRQMEKRTWLRGQVCDYLAEASEIKRLETPTIVCLRVIGNTGPMYFKIGDK